MLPKATFPLIILKSSEWSHIIMCVQIWTKPAFFFHALIYRFAHTHNISSTSKYCVLCLHLHRNRWINSPNAFQAVKEFRNLFHLSPPFSISYFRSHILMPENRKTFSGMYSKCLCLLSLVKCFDIILDTKPKLPFSGSHIILKRIQMQKVKRLGIEKREAENSENFIKIRIIWPHGC